MFGGLTVRSTSGLVPVRGGLFYRVDSPAENALVTPELAREIEKVLDLFAYEAGFTPDKPVGVVFEPGTLGHHKVGRAADIYAVGGFGMERWKQRWDHAMRAAAPPGESSASRNMERKRNLGWRLYKALQRFGRWSQPYGFPIQLFGPWTREEGPWKFISDPLLYAHKDHIHVAK